MELPSQSVVGSGSDVLSQSNMTNTPAVALGIQFLDLSEVAELLRVSRISVYRMVAKRLLAVHRVGRRMRFQKEDVLAYLGRNRYASSKD